MSERHKLWGRLTSLLWMAIGLWLTGSAFAEGPGLMNFQAVLKRGEQWVTSHGVQVCFSFYSVPTGGEALYKECDIVDVKDGLYSTYIGDNPLQGYPYTKLADALHALSSNAWLGVAIDGGAELSPRQRVTAAPYVIAGGTSKPVFSVTQSYCYAVGTTQSMDVVKANRVVVKGEARFEQGISYVAPLGDLSMGVFTNRP
ncbi:MAG: hypothetical protein N2255_02960 [Kiritimatiellae bacterium]|nr:hypothetical protein [Kiritimatiellia bacterium]